MADKDLITTPNSSQLPVTENQPFQQDKAELVLEANKLNFTEQIVNTKDYQNEPTSNLNDTIFYMNLLYLLKTGFNTLMAFNTYPYSNSSANDIREKQIIMQEYDKTNMEYRSLTKAETLKRRFNFTDLPNGNFNDIPTANKKPLLILSHKFTFAFTEITNVINKDNSTGSFIDKDNYIETFIHNYLTNKKGLREKLIANELQITKMWIDLPFILGNSAAATYKQLTGFIFKPLANSDNEDYVFFTELFKNKDLNFIQLSNNFGVSLIKAHFTAELTNGKIFTAYASAFDLLSSMTDTFSDFIRRLPPPFNNIETLLKDNETINNYGNIETNAKTLNVLNLIERWLNLNLGAMVGRNANTYANVIDMIFISPNRINDYVKITLKNGLEDLYYFYVRALTNIIKLLLLYETETGDLINIKNYLEPFKAKSE